MHELSIAERLLPAVLEAAAGVGAERVTAVTVRAGALQQLVAPTLAICFEAVAAGTIAAGATLTVEVIQPLARCRRCGAEYAVEDMVFLCPECHLADAELLRGNELLLAAVEVETCESTSSTTS